MILHVRCHYMEYNKSPIVISHSNPGHADLICVQCDVSTTDSISCASRSESAGLVVSGAFTILYRVGRTKCSFYADAHKK